MKIEQWHRRQALCLASQLPDGPDDALAVLDCVRELVGTFRIRMRPNRCPRQRFYRSFEIAKNSIEPEENKPAGSRRRYSCARTARLPDYFGRIVGSPPGLPGGGIT
jgi:hypothetical protein